MRPYLTPGRFRAMALGIDLSAKTDADLASLLASASAEVNRYCCAPTGHDFRGGTVTGEQHIWDVGNSHRWPSGRLWPYHRPLAAVSSIQINVTRNQYISFTEEQIFVNRKLGYIEPVAAPVTTALFTAVPPFLLSEPVATIDYTYGQTLTVTDEVVEPDGGVGRVYRAINQFWTDATVTVKADNSPMSSGYTLDRYEGLVILDELPALGTVISVSYAYTMPFDIALATGIVCSDMLGYSNINASGLTGLSGIRVEEIELRQSSRVGFNVYEMHPAARLLLGAYVFASWG